MYRVFFFLFSLVFSTFCLSSSGRVDLRALLYVGCVMELSAHTMSLLDRLDLKEKKAKCGQASMSLQSNLFFGSQLLQFICMYKEG